MHEMSVDGIWDFRRSVIPLDVDDDGIPLGEAEILDGTYEVGLVRPVRIQIHAVARTINGIVLVVDVTLKLTK